MIIPVFLHVDLTWILLGVVLPIGLLLPTAFLTVLHLKLQTNNPTRAVLQETCHQDSLTREDIDQSGHLFNTRETTDTALLEKLGPWKPFVARKGPDQAGQMRRPT